MQNNVGPCEDDLTAKFSDFIVICIFEDRVRQKSIKMNIEYLGRKRKFTFVGETVGEMNKEFQGRTGYIGHAVNDNGYIHKDVRISTIEEPIRFQISHELD